MAIDTAIFASSGAPLPFGGGGINNFLGNARAWALTGGSQVDVPAGDRFFTIPADNPTGIQLADGFYIVTARMLAHALWTKPSRPDPRSLVIDTRLSFLNTFGSGV